MSGLYMDQVGAVASAIRNAERCPDYYAQVGQCDGLDGCETCLELASKAALRAVERTDARR
jgi:hypothetical protein